MVSLSLPSRSSLVASFRSATSCRGKLDVEDLLKLVLALVVVWLILEILGSVLRITMTLLNAIPTVIGITIVILIVLWLTDRI